MSSSAMKAPDCESRQNTPTHSIPWCDSGLVTVQDSTQPVRRWQEDWPVGQTWRLSKGQPHGGRVLRKRLTIHQHVRNLRPFENPEKIAKRYGKVRHRALPVSAIAASILQFRSSFCRRSSSKRRSTFPAFPRTSVPYSDASSPTRFPAAARGSSFGKLPAFLGSTWLASPAAPCNSMDGRCPDAARAADGGQVRCFPCPSRASILHAVSKARTRPCPMR
jgi:hypothetical protein